MDEEQWTEARLQRYVDDQVQESLTLDFKSSGGLKQKSDRTRTDLAKDVSAFANSAGGLLIFGIEEKQHLPVRVDEGVDATVVTREWIEQVIAGNVQRRIEGLRIYPVPLERSEANRTAYVLEVPASQRAPHMAAHMYYKRYEFESVPMQDYEVRDVSSRWRSPSLTCHWNVKALGLDGQPRRDEGGRSFWTVQLRFSVTNESDTPAQYAVFRPLIDARLHAESFGNTSEPPSETDAAARGRSWRVHLHQLNHSLPGSLPIWAGQSWTLKEQTLLDVGEGQYFLGWTASAPGMSERSDSCLLEVGPNGVGILPSF